MKDTAVGRFVSVLVKYKENLIVRKLNITIIINDVI